MSMNAKQQPQAPIREIHSRIRPRSSEDNSKQYISTLYMDGHAHCTCEGFRYRETCKHIDVLRADYQILRAPVRANPYSHLDRRVR